MTAAALWAMVLALGVQTGAGIFETRVLVPLWSKNLQAYFSNPLRPDSGKRLWIILSPITALISVVNLIVALMSNVEARAWWIAASAISLVVMAVTFGYFVPALLAFARDAGSPPDDVAAKVKRWVLLNYVRAALLIVAWIAALKAFASVAR